MHAYLLLIALLSSFSFAAAAAPSDELEQTQADLAKSKAKQEEIARKQEKIEKELIYIQHRLVSLAGNTQKSETEMASARDNLRILNDELARKTAQLEKRRKNLAALVQAALHLNQLPPEMVVMLSEEEHNKNTMKATSALRMTANSIREEMESIQSQSEELANMKKKTAMRRNMLSEKKDDLSEERKELGKKLAQRQMLQEKLGHSREEEEKRTAELGKKAESLQALVKGLNTGSRWNSGKKSNRSFAEAKGKLRIPVAGKMIQGYGNPKHPETSKGMVISAAANGAQVVAPFDAEVAFAGTFLTYGKMVILKHTDDFHTLLAGLGTIDARAGDFLLEGEPIGAMKNDEVGSRLYFELRKDNQPVNPEPWIKNLKNTR